MSDMMFESEMQGDIMFRIFPILFGIGVVFIAGIFLLIIISLIKQRRRDNASPILTVMAKVVDKRQHVSRGMNDDCMSSFPDCYVTFEVESGSRMELRVPEERYGLIVKGDQGKLTFQGSRFKEFERK